MLSKIFNPFKMLFDYSSKCIDDNRFFAWLSSMVVISIIGSIVIGIIVAILFEFQSMFWLGLLACAVYTIHDMLKSK